MAMSVLFEENFKNLTNFIFWVDKPSNKCAAPGVPTGTMFGGIMFYYLGMEKPLY